MMFDGWSLTNEHGEYTNNDTREKKWWTELLLDDAYDIVKSRKWPILIPSYTNPDSGKGFVPPAIKGFLSGMDENFNYPIFIFVRESQEKSYKEENKHPYVTIVPYKDSLIDSAGKARLWSLKWLYKMGYENAFSFDDDALGIGLTKYGVTGKGDPKSEAIKNANISKVLAVWQYSMEKLQERFDNVVLTAPYPIGFSWKNTYCWMDESVLLYRGNLNQVVCLNVKNLVDNGLYYKDNRECGHEDIQLILESLHKDMIVATFPFIWYSTPPMDIANFSAFGNTMKDRFNKQQEIMKSNWDSDPWVIFREKRGLAQVVINFRRFRKDKGITKYVLGLFGGEKEIS